MHKVASVIFILLFFFCKSVNVFEVGYVVSIAKLLIVSYHLHDHLSVGTVEQLKLAAHVSVNQEQAFFHLSEVKVLDGHSLESLKLHIGVLVFPRQLHELLVCSN